MRTSSEDLVQHILASNSHEETKLDDNDSLIVDEIIQDKVEEESDQDSIIASSVKKNLIELSEMVDTSLDEIKTENKPLKTEDTIVKINERHSIGRKTHSEFSRDNLTKESEGVEWGGFKSLSSSQITQGVNRSSFKSHIGVPTLNIRLPVNNFCNLVLGFIFLFITIPLYHLEHKTKDIDKYIFGIIAIALCCICHNLLQYLFWRIFPSITINKHGIVDNHSLVEKSNWRPDRHGFGMINYNVIESCAIDSDVLGNCSIAITLKDPDAFCANLNSKQLRSDFTRMSSVNLADFKTRPSPLPSPFQRPYFHIAIPFVGGLDADIVYAFERITKFTRLHNFRKKRWTSVHDGGH